VGLDKDGVDVTDGDLTLIVATGFDQAGQAQIAGQTQVAVDMAQDEFDGGGFEVIE
jgi:hypothetical protein